MPLFFQKSVLGNLDPYWGTSTRTREPLCTVIVYSWPVLGNLDPYSGTLKLTHTRLCSQVPHSREFTMSHGSYDLNLGSEIFILAGDIRLRSWTNIVGIYGKKGLYQKNEIQYTYWYSFIQPLFYSRVDSLSLESLNRHNFLLKFLGL